MHKFLRSMSWCAPLALLLAAASAPQSPSPVFDPAQLPTVHGVIARYTLVPNGSVDGFLLEDGMQILVVPLFSREILETARPGDVVTVYGLKASGKALVMAMAVINDRSRHSVLLGEIPLMLAMGRTPHHEGGPPPAAAATPPSSMPAPGPMAPVRLHGIVVQPIYGPLGTLSGAVLNDGTLLRVASSEGTRVASLLAIGAPVWVSGEGQDSSLGKLVLVKSLGASEHRLIELAPWDGPR